ncbi:MAG: selenocysteine-specific translation elongation factor [Candidatus Cloacimonadota bacterium]|nr:MAG: selenocysteine-specific translation elongation factor [Candidatus Cloacimonadota bacterium]
MGKIIGTAGHVDHGKTELIKALTGIDTDRLSEEKERGLTIDLGFAYIDLEKSGRIGIIDVPGHERFLKNMLAGVGGMDVVILVIAANESVMPQTKEHFQIMRLLGVKDVIIGISKIDTVDEETRFIVKEEVQDLIHNTPYEDSPIVEFSSVTGEGLSQITEVLDERVSKIRERGSKNQFTRLAIDRCFELKGIGTVITGTLLSGSIEEGEEIVILPPGHKTKARQIQEHNVRKNKVLAGERVAINLPGIEKRMVERGNIISKEGQLSQTDRLLVLIEPVKETGDIKDLTRVRIYLGSGEYLGRLELIGKRKVSSDKKFISFLVLEEKIIALRKDKFILRMYSPMKLLGGGLILDAFPKIKRRFSQDALKEVEKLIDASDGDTLLFYLHGSHLPGENLRKRMQLPPAEFKSICDILLKDGSIVILGDEIFSSNALEAIKKDIIERVDRFHKKNPLKKGLDKEGLRTALDIERNIFDLLLSSMVEIKVEKNYVKLSHFTPQFDEETSKRKKRILASLKKNPFKPDKLEEDDLIRNLVGEGEIVKIKENMYFHRDAVEQGEKLIREAIEKRGPLGVSEIKDLLKTTRKYIIPFLEYLDRIKFTVRKGDLRDLWEREI